MRHARQYASFNTAWYAVLCGPAIAFAEATVAPRAHAQTSSAVRYRTSVPASLPPIVFVHGNGDHAGLWDTNIWRFASNGYPERLLFSVDLPNPTASSTVTASEVNRSTPEEQTAALAAFVTRVLLKTGASKVVLVGSSRGGMTIQNYVRFGGGAAHVSHVVTCGAPHHGVFALSAMQLESEFNGAGPYLQSLNRGSEVVAGVRYLTIRSDSLDKYAQPDGAALGLPAGTKTGVGFDGPALKGARNVVLRSADHREVAFSAAAFREQYTFVVGKAPTTTTIRPDTIAVLNGLVSGVVNGAPTNLPLRGATVTVHEVNPKTGERIAESVHRVVTNHTGRWGPLRARPQSFYEFEISAPDSSVIMHVFRSPFPRSSDIVNFRLMPPAPPRADSVSVLLVRPRGYLGLGRDTVEINGAAARGIPKGVPTIDRVSQWFDRSAPRSVQMRFNGEVIVVRTQPSDPRRVVLAELSGS